MKKGDQQDLLALLLPAIGLLAELSLPRMDWDTHSLTAPGMMILLSSITVLTTRKYATIECSCVAEKAPHYLSLVSMFPLLVFLYTSYTT